MNVKWTLNLLLLLMAMLLVACGGAEGDSAEVAPTEAPAEEAEPTDAPEATEETMEAEMAEEDGAFPLTIEHKYGSTDIPAQPQRVVSVGYSEQDELLALGVVPVGLRYWYGDYDYAVWPWSQEALGDAQPEIIGTGELNFEAITALEPDLIVGLTSGMSEEEYELLSQIAPTVAQPGEYVDYGVPWQEVTRILGRVTGTSERAEELVTDLESRFIEIREAHPEFDGASLAVAFAFDGTPGVYASQDPRPRLLGELGFETPELYDEVAGDAFYLTFSEEELPQFLDVDTVVWLAGSDEGIEQIRQHPLRPSLRVAQEGREVFLGELLGGAFSFSSPLSINYLLDELVPMLEAAVDGDPETTLPGGATDMGDMEDETAEASGECEEGFRLFDHEALATDPICVPEDPQNVAFIDEMIGIASVLGVQSATRSVYFDLLNDDFPNAFTEEQIANMTDIGHPRETSAETVLLAEPDLVISGNYWEDANSFLGEIAPTVIWDYDYTLDWQVYFEGIAEVLNRSEEGAAVIAGLEERLAILSEEIEEKDQTFVVVRTMDELDNIQVFTTYNFGASYVDGLGLSMPEDVLTPEEAAEVQNAWWYPLSVETLPYIDADHIFLLSGWEPEVQEEFLANPLWQSLEAVQNDQVHFIEGEYWVRSHPLSAHRVIDDLFTYVAGVDSAEVAPNPYADTYEASE